MTEWWRLSHIGISSGLMAGGFLLPFERERVVGCAGWNGRLSAEGPAASSPQTSAILEIREKIGAPTIDAQGNGVGRAPLVDGVGVKETNQGMATTLRHIQDARSGKWIVERRGRDDLPIKCRLTRRRDEAANFASRSAGIASGITEAKVLDDLSWARIYR